MFKVATETYQSHDVWSIAKGLLGKTLYTFINGELTAGYIVEVEAYHGVEDKACHAYGNRLTARTSTMYLEGGIAYVYLCYGIHHLLNIVTATSGHPHAVLIRGLQPKLGLDTMLRRRGLDKLKPSLTAGPGALARAMGVDHRLNGVSFSSDEIWIEEDGLAVKPKDIVACPRIGVGYAQEHASLPWRYYIAGNAYVSKPYKLNASPKNV